MYKILVNAYAISPTWGSEPGMGWNWVRNLAKFCELYIITEGEWEIDIEEALKTLPQARNMHFYYLPVSNEIRTMCWNQGDWRFYKHYRDWEWSAYAKALEIMKEVNLDIVHHLNMICFREPGYFWKIHDKPFVWGPVGGMELMPTAYLKGESFKLQFKEYLKNFLNNIQRNYHPRVLKAMHRANALAAATKGVYEYIHDYHKVDVILINETGCNVNESNTEFINRKRGKKTFDLIWVGKYDYRKQLSVALNTMALLKDCTQIRLHVVGTGYDADVAHYHKQAEDLQLGKQVVFHHKVLNTEVHEMMKKADLLFFTSIMDATSTVVLEAIGNGLPIVCHDCCGFGSVVDNEIGRKVRLSNPQKSAEGFASIIRELNSDRELVLQMSFNCIKHQAEVSWESNARKMVELYEKAIKEFYSKK